MGLILTTFNVRDLIDTGDAGYLERKIAWTAEKLDRLPWDVLALQEVGPLDLLAEVLSRLARKVDAAPVMGTADKRGIRCALVSRVRVLEAKVLTHDTLTFPVFHAGDPPPFGARVPLRRGVVFARVDGGNAGPIDVLVAHFKSRRPLAVKSAEGVELEPKTTLERADAELRSLVWRAMEARFVRAAVDERLAQGSINVAVMGDLNDVPESVTLSVIRGEGDGELRSAAMLLPETRRYSVLHGGGQALIDHVLMTPALFDRVESAEVITCDLHEDTPEEDAAVGTGAAADSDHAPLVVRLR